MASVAAGLSSNGWADLGVGAAVGSRAPGVVCQTLTGKPTDLGAIAHNGRVTVFNFWATWCGPCIRELPEFAEVFATLAPRGLYMVGINAGEPMQKVAAFAKDIAVPFDLVLDPDGLARKAYSAGPSLPLTVLIDGKGIVRQRIQGATSGSTLRARVVALLNA